MRTSPRALNLSAGDIWAKSPGMCRLQPMLESRGCRENIELKRSSLRGIESKTTSSSSWQWALTYVSRYSPRGCRTLIPDVACSNHWQV